MVTPLVATWAILLAAGIAGFGLGFGLVCGAFVARALRRYMATEGLQPYGRERNGKSDGNGHGL